MITQIKRLCIAVGHAVGTAACVIGEVERRVRAGLLSEHLRAVQRVAGRDAVHRFLRADPVGVIGKGQRLISYHCALQLAPVLPGEGHPVSPRQRVADLVVGERFTAVACQQILPRVRAVGIGDGLGLEPPRLGLREDIAALIVGVGVGVGVADHICGSTSKHRSDNPKTMLAGIVVLHFHFI